MKQIYDWDNWFGRRRFVLRYGRDYQCATYSMGQMVRNQAARRHVSISIKPSGETGLVVDVHNPLTKEK